MSVMSLCKPQLESIFNTIVNDAESVVEFQDHLSEFLADAMAKRRIKKQVACSHFWNAVSCSDRQGKKVKKS
jgi:hypothetical protein